MTLNADKRNEDSDARTDSVVASPASRTASQDAGRQQASQCTPGPWVARNQQSGSGEDLGWIIEVDSGRGGRVGWSSRAFADTNHEEQRGGPEAKANAYLIAAAPELLAALKAIVAVLQKEAPRTPLNHHQYDAIGIQAHNAIKKAEGR